MTQQLAPIRWIELGLPHTVDPQRLIFLQADGPFALRKWYRHPEGEGEYHLDLETLDAKRDQFDCGRMLLTHLGAEMSNRRGKLEIETADDGLAVDL